MSSFLNSEILNSEVFRELVKKYDSKTDETETVFSESSEIERNSCDDCGGYMEIVRDGRRCKNCGLLTTVFNEKTTDIVTGYSGLNVPLSFKGDGDLYDYNHVIMNAVPSGIKQTDIELITEQIKSKLLPNSNVPHNICIEAAEYYQKIKIGSNKSVFRGDVRTSIFAGCIKIGFIINNIVYTDKEIAAMMTNVTPADVRNGEDVVRQYVSFHDPIRTIDTTNRLLIDQLNDFEYDEKYAGFAVELTDVISEPRNVEQTSFTPETVRCCIIYIIGIIEGQKEEVERRIYGDRKISRSSLQRIYKKVVSNINNPKIFSVFGKYGIDVNKLKLKFKN